MNVFQKNSASQDMRDFLNLLEKKGQLKRISRPVDADLELAAISDRVLGKALGLYLQPRGRPARQHRGRGQRRGGRGREQILAVDRIQV